MWNTSVTSRCVLVPTDQWLVTHIDTTWKISEVKWYLLAKIFPSAFISTPYLPRAQTSSRRRAVSPIRFAAQPQPTVAHQSEGEDEYDEEDEDLIGDEMFSQYKWSANPRRSTTVVPMIARPDAHTSAASSSSHEDKLLSETTHPTQYTLVAFSSGQILEDQFHFDWFNLNPHELLEMHTAGFLVPLPRHLPHHYVLPYFEARVWALRAISRDIDDFDGAGRKGDSMESSPYGSDDRSADLIRRDKLSKKRRTKLEWRVRWLIIHQGYLKLCKTRDGDKSTHVSPLSSVVAIRGAEHLSAGLTSSLPHHDQSSSKGNEKENGRPEATNIVSIKFRSEKSAQHLQPRSSLPETADGAVGTSGNWWRRGSRDANGGQERWRDGTPDSDTLFDGNGSGEAESQERKDKSSDNGVLIVLDVRDGDLFQHVLRLLHLQAPTTAYSSFFPNSGSSMTAPDPVRQPTQRHASMDSNLNRPPSPISFASHDPTIIPPSSPSSSQSLISFDSSLPSRPLSPPLPISTEIVGVKYPAWRRKVYQRARRAGMGSMGTAVSHHVFGDSSSDGEENDRSSNAEDLWEPDGSNPVITGHRSLHSLAETETLADEGDEDSNSSLLYKTGVFDGEDSDTSSSVSDDDARSDMEWEGWAHGVQRQRDEAITRFKESREKNAIRWDSNWAWGIDQEQTGGSRSAHEEQSISPRADQTSFVISPSQSAGSANGGSRSVTSYASVDSLFKRTIKRNTSTREPGSATVVGNIIRTDAFTLPTESSEIPRTSRPRSPLTAEVEDDVDEVEGDDARVSKPKYTYVSPQSTQQVQLSSRPRRHQAEAAAPSSVDSDAPFYSYYGSSQRLPMSRSMEMTTISSVVSVGGLQDARSKKKKKDGRGSRKSVLTTHSPLAHGNSPSGGRSHVHSVGGGSTATTSGPSGGIATSTVGSSKSSKQRGHRSESLNGNHASGSPSHQEPPPHRPDKPKLSMNFAATSPSSAGESSAHRLGQQMSSAVSMSSVDTADWESPRFANPEEIE
ncbi:hypothetical protein EIP91_011248 [Steccherinum ochraceum]|uniref:Uncharacterized protein n=1 Tax=Steccherinum ochraceum TaxID=92696 RepID=A0A4R0RM88_9APHY|nr:hypothetical protein EIP91_011248 [Steccherinum ochraceum]